MDREKRAAFCRYRIERARDDLETAQIDLGAGKFRGAVNRAYYAIFHTASAALTWLGAERRKHSGVQAAFGADLINAGLIEPEYARILNRARRQREQQDYEFPPAPLVEEKARETVAEAERFVIRVERYLREAGALEEER